MSIKQRPLTRTRALLLFIATLWAIGLWALLQPVQSRAQQVGTSTTTAVDVITTITSTTASIAITNTSDTSSSDPSVAEATPTPEITIITPTPEFLNVFAAATQSFQLTEQATREGTPTPLPRYVRIATRTPTPRVATATPTAANSATATYHALQSTAIAFTTGTPYLLIATSTPTLTATPTIFMVTPTPRPINVLAAATRKAEQEAQALRGETPTPLPTNFVIATVTQTPRIVTNTPMPANNATATANAIYATAIAYTTGMPNVVTATPTQSPIPNPTSLPTASSTLVPTKMPTSTPTSTQTPIPSSTSTLTPTSTQSPMPPSTPTSIPTTEPTPSPMAVNISIIRFLPGATSATIDAYVESEQPVRYRLSARVGQAMTVELRTLDLSPGRIDITTLEGNLLGSAEVGKIWTGVLPATQDYYLTLQIPDDGVGHNFSFEVVILP